MMKEITDKLNDIIIECLLISIILLYVTSILNTNNIKELNIQIQQLQTQVSSNTEQIEELKRSKADNYFYKKGGEAYERISNNK